MEITVHYRKQTLNNSRSYNKYTMVDCPGCSKGKIQVVICCGLSCVAPASQNILNEVLYPQYLPVSVTLFGNKIFEDVIELR